MVAHSERRVRARGKGEQDPSFLKQVFRGLVRFFVFAVIISCVWYGTRLDMFTLASVAVVGGETIAHDEIQGLVERELEGTYFLLVPKRFTYTYPENRIREVLEKIPRIHSIRIESVSRKVLAVSFDEYLPHALWCAHGVQDKPCFFLDIKGYAFTEAPVLHGGSLVRHSVEGVEEIVSGNVIEESTLAQIDIFLNKIENELTLRVSEVIHKTTGDIEFLVNGGGAILTSGEKDFNETFENLKVLLASDEFAHIAPGNFRYIDVRFGNKIFVNEQPEPEPIEEGEASTTPDLSQ